MVNARVKTEIFSEKSDLKLNIIVFGIFATEIILEETLSLSELSTITLCHAKLSQRRRDAH